MTRTRRMIVTGLAAVAAVLTLSPAPASAATGDVITGYKDQFRLTTIANQQVEVARLSLPAGAWTVFAKLYVTPPLPSGANVPVRCVLRTGGDFDQTIVSHDAVTAYASVALNVTHTFASSDLAQLTCGHVGAAGDTTVAFTKITAIRAASATNVPLA